eukprot:TRINITY_DN8420_c0_g2_i1.p1 TRINITY_DN8420_c0_g2~~TRINITY_DN8420_c0_g2_i1.p1  ORF type:complete len:373 (+),score=74.48 TRINITY_DN8420_c0_g2_i1:52-1170(+)
MVVQRLWNFVKRHKKKFIFSGVAVGGAYIAYRIWLPRLQERLLERLLKELSGSEEDLAALTRGDGRKARDKRAHFQHQQQVSDRYARKGLKDFLVRHLGCFEIEARQAKVSSAKDKEGKLAALCELQTECLSMLVSSFYSLHLLLLFHRVEFNIVGREMLAADTVKLAAEGQAGVASETMPAHLEEFINSTDYFLEHGPQKVAIAVRRAVEICSNNRSLSPQTKVTSESLTAFVREVCQEADRELLAESKGAVTLLPPEGQPASLGNEAKNLLDETRDYLESPQLLEVFRNVTSANAGRVAELLVSTDAMAASLRDGGCVALARLFGSFVTLSKSMLGQEIPEVGAAEDCIEQFGENAIVAEFCEGLCFPAI